MEEDLREEESEDYPGGLAQLARAPALQAGGHRFDSDILHQREVKSFDWERPDVVGKVIGSTPIFSTGSIDN